MAVKPGWILLAVVTLLWLWQTAQLSASRRQVAELRGQVNQIRPQPQRGPEGFMLPLPGACLPKTDDSLPSADRPYRKGTNPGFVFTDGASCVPVPYGAGVIAAAGGEVVKAEADFKELSRAEFEALVRAVANGANPRQMDRLRGREVWVRHPDGQTTVYAHLSAVAPGVRAGAEVVKGEFIGQVGNSGTAPGVRGEREGARLLFELWDGEPDKDKYFGQDLPPADVRARGKLEFGLP